MQIENKRIGKNYPVYIIAEAGVNHNNDLSLAFKMVDIAKESGADAIKFQTFKANNIQLQNSLIIGGKPSLVILIGKRQ